MRHVTVPRTTEDLLDFFISEPLQLDPVGAFGVDFLGHVSVPLVIELAVIRHLLDFFILFLFLFFLSLLLLFLLLSFLIIKALLLLLGGQLVVLQSWIILREVRQVLAELEVLFEKSDQ